MSMDQQNLCVFVYGTLKRGYQRHPSISQQLFLGEACTVPRFRLYDLGEYPGMIGDTSGASISGELFAVSEECLGRLDEIECVNQGLYSRQPVELLPPWNERKALTYIYEQSVTGCREIPVWPFPFNSKTES
jgi:gamma-glutamylcyclotransferase (GGCT)/AIG2-like uncharacterized protein YtfP